MTRKYEWSQIAENKKFLHLQKKKTAFLISLWVAGALPYLLLTIGAGYAPELFKARVLGRINVGYLMCMVQFFMMIAIGIYYTYRTNKDFDPLTKELLEEIETSRGRA